MSKILLTAAAFALTAASLLPLGADVPVATAEATAPATIQDLHTAALNYEVAHNAFKNDKNGELVLAYHNAFRARIACCQKESKKIVKKVKQGMELSDKMAKKFKEKKPDDETKEFAKGEVLNKLDRFLKRMENGSKREATCLTACGCCSFGLMKVAKDYYVSLLNVDRALYAQREAAGHAFRQTVKSLLNQGMTAETIKEEMQKAGVKDEFILGKAAFWAART